MFASSMQLFLFWNDNIRPQALPIKILNRRILGELGDGG
jgi:hypothetical protein